MLTRCLPLWFCLLLLAMGCGQTPQSASENFGRFEGDVVAVWDSDGRHMTLREDFAYVDPKDRRWLAPAGTTVDGASIPRAFWTLVGGPFEGRFRNASVIHDVGCVKMEDAWEDVHRVFYEACRCGGVDEQKAKMLYYAVYHFGPRWSPVEETQVQSRTTPDGQIVQESVTVTRLVRDDPPPPTEEEVQQVAEFIVEDNPDPELIKRVDRETLRRRPRGNRAAGGAMADSSGAWHSPAGRKPAGDGPRESQPKQADSSGGEKGQRLAERPTGSGAPDNHSSNDRSPPGKDSQRPDRDSTPASEMKRR
ncbi:MAG: DUF1353 domain-containing protein [Rhodopirellula sp.]|nr:DUF1353 domain-containing protein [Rhodopirellula sp.]